MPDRPHIVVLDAHTVNPGDLSWERLRSLGQCHIYERSTASEVARRSADADIILVNKVPLDRELLEKLDRLRGIVVTATGYNNIDLVAARERGIPVSNARGYSTDSVAQHVFALLLALVNRVDAHNESVQRGVWAAYPDFSYTLSPITELAGKTLGIYGFGRIGQAVGEIGRAFGMSILATHKHPERDARNWVEFVPLEELFARSWAITLHAPLTDANAGIVNLALLEKMSPDSYLINTARGGLIKEEDLRTALENDTLAGAALDVLSSEPPPEDHPLYGLANCLITPHLAWASREARERLIEISVENVRAMLKGEPRNVVN